MKSEGETSGGWIHDPGIRPKEKSVMKTEQELLGGRWEGAAETEGAQTGRGQRGENCKEQQVVVLSHPMDKAFGRGYASVQGTPV